MKLLIEMFGEESAKTTYNYLNAIEPNMHEDWYVRNTIRLLT